jgi:hypothetical protein
MVVVLRLHRIDTAPLGFRGKKRGALAERRRERDMFIEQIIRWRSKSSSSTIPS